MKVERQLLEVNSRPIGGFERGIYERYRGSKPTIQSKVVPKEQIKSDGASGTKQRQPTSNPSGRKCFKCHVLHIASNRPNRRMVALVEEEDFGEETCEDDRELGGGAKEELIQVDQGKERKEKNGKEKMENGKKK